MCDAIEQRRRLLRSIANSEIAHHQTEDGLLAAGIDGSLATGSVWESSDLDFTVVPLPGTSVLSVEVEWGARHGIPWHKHITRRVTLQRLTERYPDSLIEPAQGRFDADGNWFLDGLAVMEIVTDEDGTLSRAHDFAGLHRFDDEVRWPRVRHFLNEIERLMARIERTQENLESMDTLGTIRGGGGLATVAAQVCMEVAGRTGSAKEAESNLRHIERDFGVTGLGDTYASALGCDAELANSAVPDFQRLARLHRDFYRRFDALNLRPSRWMLTHDVQESWTGHVLDRLSCAPAHGCPSLIFLQLPSWQQIFVREHAWMSNRLLDSEHSAAAEFIALAGEMTEIADNLTDRLNGPVNETAAGCARSARKLIELTEAFVQDRSPSGLV